MEYRLYRETWEYSIDPWLLIPAPCLLGQRKALIRPHSSKSDKVQVYHAKTAAATNLWLLTRSPRVRMLEAYRGRVIVSAGNSLRNSTRLCGVQEATVKRAAIPSPWERDPHSVDHADSIPLSSR